MVNELFVFPADWRTVLTTEIQKGYFSKLLETLSELYKAGDVLPPRHELFRAFELCPFADLKVVIVGQDPYHTAGQAHGLCFSVNEGVKVPPSLKNIFKELQNDLGDFTIPASGDLSGWARQGVLLLNSALSVRPSAPGSHRQLGWERFTDAVIEQISEKKDAVVFMLWGNYALSKRRLIDEKKHLILTAAHPSPLARGAFFGCRHFTKTNNWLYSKGLHPVSWRL